MFNSGEIDKCFEENRIFQSKRDLVVGYLYKDAICSKGNIFFSI